MLLTVHAAGADGQVVEAVHGPGHHQDAGLEGTDPYIPLVVFRESVDFPAGHVEGNPGQAGFAEAIRGLVIDMQAFRFSADDVGLVSGALVRPVGQQRYGLAGAGARIGGRPDAARCRLVDVQAAHGADEDVSVVGVLGKTAGHDSLIQGDVRPAHRRPVHHGKAAGLTGQPHAAGGILEQTAHEDGREIAAQEFATVVLQRVRLRVQDIDALRGCRHPHLGQAGAGLEFDDVGDIGRRRLRGAVHVHEVEGTVVRVEGLQAPGGAYP